MTLTPATPKAPEPLAIQVVLSPGRAVSKKAQRRKPTQAILDLQLPPEFLDLLFSPLRNLGFILDKDETQDEYGADKRTHTVAKNNVGKRALLFIPGEILDDPTQDNLKEMNSLVFAFQPESILIIFSTLHTSPPWVIEKIIEERWLKARQVKGYFIPQRQVKDLQVMPSEAQKLWVIDRLKLKDLLQDAQVLISVTQMLPEDVEELVRIIVRLPQFTDTGGQAWRLLFQNVGLDRLSGDFELRGDPRTVARTVLYRLKNYRPVPEKQDHEVLGLLLCHILTFGELPPTDGISIKDIVKKYKLIPPSQQL